MVDCLFHGNSDCPAAAELDYLDEQIDMRLKAEKERDEWKARAEQYKRALDAVSAQQIERMEHGNKESV